MFLVLRFFNQRGISVKLSDYIADFLSKLTGHAFTGHGGCIVHLLDSLESHPKIKIVPCQNEQGASLAADAYTRNGPKTSYNVGMVQGGTSINSIPAEVSMQVDMRSESQDRLIEIDSIFQRSIHKAVREGNVNRRTGPALNVDIELIGDRPSGEISSDEILIQRAIASTELLNLTPVLGRSSTDSNIPISLGIPAITIGGGGIGVASHSPDEYYINENGPRGIQRALLILLSQAGMVPLS